MDTSLIRTQLNLGQNVLGEDLIWAANVAATGPDTEFYSRTADPARLLYEVGQTSLYGHLCFRVAPALDNLVVDPRRTYASAWIIAHEWPRDISSRQAAHYAARVNAMNRFAADLATESTRIANRTDRSDRLQQVDVCNFIQCQQALEMRDTRRYCQRHGFDKPWRTVWVQIVGTAT